MEGVLIGGRKANYDRWVEIDDAFGVAGEFTFISDRDPERPIPIKLITWPIFRIPHATTPLRAYNPQPHDPNSQNLAYAPSGTSTDA